MNKEEENYRYCQVSQPAVAAHRGASMRYPENSLAAFKEAINIAMENPEVRFFIEMDVRSTKDKKLVLMHDSDVSRTTNSEGYTEEMLLVDMQKLSMKSVSEIVPSGHACPDRVHKPLFTITEQDLRVASLDEVLELVKTANKLRGEIGSPIGLALELKPKPPIKMFSKQAKFFATMVASILDILGFTEMAKKMLPPTSSIEPLAELFNNNTKYLQDMPFILFSVSGVIGERDMKILWNKLTPEAKLNIMHNPDISNLNQLYIASEFAQATAMNKPHSLPVNDFEHSSALSRFIHKINCEMEGFWLIGSLKSNKSKMSGIPIISNANILDKPEDIRSAIEGGATFITANYPERVINILKEHGCENYADEALRGEEIMKAKFAEQEIKRRADGKSGEVALNA